MHWSARPSARQRRQKDAPASKAGIEIGDIIIKADGGT